MSSKKSFLRSNVSTHRRSQGRLTVRDRGLRRGRGGGFTLLELLLVMAILVILGSLGAVAVLNVQAGTQKKAAFAQIRLLKNACTTYNLDVQSFPKKLEDLVNLPPGVNNAIWNGPYLEDGRVPLDPWQNQFKYSANPSTNQVTITSAGPDGQHGTSDDVTI